MDKKQLNKAFRRTCTFLLLLAVLIQVTTVVLLLTGFSGFNVGEVHEIAGFSIFGLIIVHIIIFRKSLKAMLFSKLQ